MEDDAVTRWLAALPEQQRRAAAGLPGGLRASDDAYEWALTVLFGYLGLDWMQRELDGRHPNNLLLLGGDPDSEERPDGPDERLRRPVMLAHYLQTAESRGVQGFEEYVRELPKRRLVDVLAELRAVMHLTSSGVVVHLQPEAESRQADLRADFAEGEVWAEVKAKQEWPDDYRASKVLNSLKDTLGQLPSAGPGLVYLQIPPSWGDDPQSLSGVESVAREWLRQTRRVNAVVVLLERRLPLPTTGRRITPFDFHVLNDAPRTPHAELEDWLESLPQIV